MDEGDNSLNLLDKDSLSALSKPNNKELLRKLFDHNIGSTLMIKIPYYFPQIIARWVSVAPKKMLRANIRRQLTTIKPFKSFPRKACTNGEGKWYIPYTLLEALRLRFPIVMQGIAWGHSQQRYRNSSSWKLSLKTSYICFMYRQRRCHKMSGVEGL